MRFGKHSQLVLERHKSTSPALRRAQHRQRTLGFSRLLLVCVILSVIGLLRSLINQKNSKSGLTSHLPILTVTTLTMLAVLSLLVLIPTQIRSRLARLHA